jgi:MarR family transcriptional regulator, organic hydroperoxide resistance regulator
MSRAAKPRRPGARKSRTEQPHRRAGAVSKPAAGMTAADRIVLEIRRFIAASIFFNARAAEHVGLGLTDMQLLNLLQLHGPSTPGHLASWSGLSSGGVTVALDRLAKAGYVGRGPNPADRRSLLVTLQPRRVRQLDAMYASVEAETRRLLATLSQGDLEAVIRFFATLGAARADTRIAPRSRFLGAEG